MKKYLTSDFAQANWLNLRGWGLGLGLNGSYFFEAPPLIPIPGALDPQYKIAVATHFTTAANPSIAWDRVPINPLCLSYVKFIETFFASLRGSTGQRPMVDEILPPLAHFATLKKLDPESPASVLEAIDRLLAPTKDFPFSKEQFELATKTLNTAQRMGARLPYLTQRLGRSYESYREEAFPWNREKHSLGLHWKEKYALGWDYKDKTDEWLPSEDAPDIVYDIITGRWRLTKEYLQQAANIDGDLLKLSDREKTLEGITYFKCDHLPNGCTMRLSKLIRDHYDTASVVGVEIQGHQIILSAILQPKGTGQPLMPYVEKTIERLNSPAV